MEVEVTQKERKKQSRVTTIWKALSESFTVDNLPVFCNPMLDTLDPNTLDLIDDDKSLEMALLHTNKEPKTVHRKLGK